jgi:hypothetical protein
MRHRHDDDLPLLPRDVDGTSRAASKGAQSHVRLVPPLPPTLVLEGADQPFGLEIVAAQSSIGRRAG